MEYKYDALTLNMSSSSSLSMQTVSAPSIVSESSQVFVMGWSLDILHVFVFPFDSSVSKFFMRDVIFAMSILSCSLPVPVESANVFQSCHLFISQIGDDPQHTSAISIESEDVLVEESSLPGDLLEVETSNAKAEDDPLSIHGVLPQ